MNGDITPSTCPYCDFGSGQRGMDSCGKCDGTGSLFWVGRKFFPNTELGYNEAIAATEADK